MCKKDENGAPGSAAKPKKVPGIPFTRLNAKQAQEASVRARNLRKQVRAEMLNTLVENLNFGEEMLKAIKKGDTEKADLIIKALTVVGLTHNQSEDAVQNVKVDAKTDANVVQTVRFCLAPKPEKTPENKD